MATLSVPRKERTPIGGTRDILTVKDKDPNFVYRWVLDVPGRLAKFKEAGYEVVTDNLEVGQDAVDRPKQKLGSVITKLSGMNTLVLMRIPKEWYVEDQKAKQDKVDLLEESMQDAARRGIIPGSNEPGYGTLNISGKRK